jgi:hypothetical protein
MAGSVLVLDAEQSLAPGFNGASVLEARRLPRPVAGATMVGPQLDSAAASRVVREATEEATRLASKLEQSGIVPPIAESVPSSSDDKLKAATRVTSQSGSKSVLTRMPFLAIDDEDDDDDDDGDDAAASGAGRDAIAEPIPSDVVDSYFRSSVHDAVYFMALRCCERLQESRPQVTLDEVCFRLIRTLARAAVVVTAKELGDAADGGAAGSSEASKPKPEMFGPEMECVAACITWARS